MAEGDKNASSAVPGGAQADAAVGGSGSHEAQSPGGESQRTNPIMNAELQLQQVMGSPRQGAQSTSLSRLAGRFEGSNWFLWKARVLSSFKRLKLLSVISGAEVAPALGDAEYEGWADKDAIAHDKLISCFSDSVLDSVRTCVTALDVWRKLVSKYEKVSCGRRHRLKVIFISELQRG